MVGRRVKALRTHMTDAERKLWRALRSRGLQFKFRRQVPLGPYVVDFVCFETKVIVEVDGGQHASSVSDAVRDRYFTDQGYRVLRFWNNEVLGNLEGVLTIIVMRNHPSPGAARGAAPPSPSRGEGYRARGEGIGVGGE
jgi:very-short-patch-repair endonuclease